MGELNKQTCFRKHSSFVLSLWPTCLPTHSSRPSLTRPSLNSLSPLQTSPPSSLPSRLAGSLIPSLARVRSLSSPLLTRPSPSCPMQHSLICWILPTRRSWMPFSPTTSWRVLLPSQKTSQTVRRSRLSRDRTSPHRSTWGTGCSSTKPSSLLPMLAPPTVSSTSSTKCLVFLLRLLQCQQRTSSSSRQVSPISRARAPSLSSLLPTRPSPSCPKLHWPTCSNLRTSRSCSWCSSTTWFQVQPSTQPI